MCRTYFNYPEFECPCCQENKTDRKMIDKLNKAREYAEVPFVITSGFRCEKHNLEVGGRADSAHLSGHAADIKCVSSRPRWNIIRGLLLAGFTRIGIANTFIHADTDDSKPPAVVWLY